MEKEKNDKNKITDRVRYKQKRLTVAKTGNNRSTLNTFNSFEESNEADAKAKANTPPEHHLLNVTNRIKEMYADELKTPMGKT
jgi:hypothetical protein